VVFYTAMNSIFRLLLGCICGLALLAAQPVSAITVSDLYEVTLPAESGSRDSAFVDALKAVAVRVSGQRDAGSRLGAATANPRQYVQRFGFTGDNQLQVGFDGPAIDRLLNDVGLPIWGRERPATLVVLTVDASDGSARWIDARTATAEKDLVTKAARQRGLPLIWPESDSGLSVSSSPADLQQLATSYSANATLFGKARADGAGGYTVRWTLISQDGAKEIAGSLDEGVNLAADTFARVYAASGSALDNIVVEVSGIANLNAYASTLNYLEAMTLVRAVSVENLMGETLRFKLSVRGDLATLRRALALDNRLVPLAQSPEENERATDRLQLRYQP
jgi:hypothetical protein